MEGGKEDGIGDGWEVHARDSTVQQMRPAESRTLNFMLVQDVLEQPWQEMGPEGSTFLKHLVSRVKNGMKK